MDYTTAYLTVTSRLYHFQFIARSFVKSAQQLMNADPSDHGQSFNLLISTAFELWPKVLIAAKQCQSYQDNMAISEEQIRSRIMTEISSSGHNLQKLFDQVPELKHELGILDITKVPNVSDHSREWFVSEYRFKLVDYPRVLSIKDSEGVRYGSFSRQKDVAFVVSDNERIMELLLNTQAIVTREKDKIINNMRKVKDNSES
jgi:hypothetical protein